MWSVDDGEIENVENISLNAEGYIYTYYKLKYLIDKEPNISHVYLGLGYHNLSSYFDDYIYGHRFGSFIHRYLGVMQIADFVEVIFRNPKDMPTLVRNIYQKGGRSGLKQQCTLYGSFPDERKMETFNISQMKKRILEQYYDDGDVIGISRINLEYLNKIVALLRSNNVDVTLLSTPLHTDYIELVPTEYKRLFDDYIERNELTVYMFEDLDLSDAEFLPDGDHVNFEGAKLTTVKFNNYHENIND